ncbi:SDR family NAD(P)-dependent oxidoreductase [Rhodococcus sp. 077-4]|uniref:SDR family NAD(P)-dependent oxidoreductase n=1 Tax=Rhodococcus sp. 077-4 TaxID=2789271 RepID=UPI0039F50185
MDDFSQRVGTSFVAGGTGGIGRAIALTLAERGSNVAFTFHGNRAGAHDLVAEIEERGAKASAEQLDLSDADATAHVIERTAAHFGGLHTVVYAAGPHVPMIHLSRVTPAQFKKQLDSDAAAFFNLAHSSLRHLRTSKGNIVVVSTAATRRFPVRDGLSSSTKGAVEQLALGLAAEEGRFGIRVNCVGPGMLTDGMAARLIASGELDDAALEITKRNIPLRRFGDAQDIAEAVAFLASDRADFISGQMLDVDGGYGV